MKSLKTIILSIILLIICVGTYSYLTYEVDYNYKKENSIFSNIKKKIDPEKRKKIKELLFPYKLITSYKKEIERLNFEKSFLKKKN